MISLWVTMHLDEQPRASINEINNNEKLKF